MTEESFERLYRAYFSQVYRYVLQLCGDEQAAQDVTAETFFRALSKLDSFRREASPGTWLCAIARREWLTRVRREKRQIPMEALPEQAAPDDLEDQLEARRAREAIDRLPPDMRDVFLMRADGGMAFREIGRLLGHTENWACVTYHRARQKLQHELEGKA